MRTFEQQYLYLAVFASGMTVLAVELSAGRLLGNVFGTSNLVWANIIGLMLIYLTAGYFIGGWWADRAASYQRLYQIICWGAFLSGVAPLIARPVLYAAAQAVYEINAGVALGSFLSVILLFAAPITLLGCVAPFALKLALTDLDKAGQTAGRLYAISTLGSIVGTFAPVLYLIPQAGTARTFLIFAFGLLAIGLGGLWSVERRAAWRLAWMPFLLAGLAVFVLSRPQRPVPIGYTLLYEKDSAYNYIQIVEDGNGYRYLWLNEGQGIHSQWHPTELYYRRTWDFFLAGPYFNPDFSPQQMGKIAIVGLAGGTIAHQHTAVYGAIPIDGIEIDGEIIKASQRYLGMTMPNLNPIVDDARYALRQLDGGYSMIGVDAYRVPYIPWQLTTQQFFQEVEQQLAQNGVLVINVGRTPTDRSLERALASTILTVFPSLYRVDVPDSLNTILIATRQPTQADALLQNFRTLDSNAYPLLWQVLQDTLNALQPVETSDVVFTDDRAPVETMVNRMTIEFLLNGDLATLE
jgi:spermidine synthase